MNIGNRTAYYGRECFVFMHNFIRIVIPFEKDENGLENVTENVLENKTQLSERQIKIIELLIATGEHNVAENVVENVAENSATLSKILDVSERTIQRDLAQLQELGHIRHVGPGKGGRWQVLKTINNKK